MKLGNLLNMKEAAIYLDTNYERIKVLKRNNYIPYLTIGTRDYFSKEKLDEWLNSLDNQKTNQVN